MLGFEKLNEQVEVAVGSMCASGKGSEQIHTPHAVSRAEDAQRMM